MMNAEAKALELLTDAVDRVQGLFEESLRLEDELDAVRIAVRRFIDGPNSATARERLMEETGIWADAPLPYASEDDSLCPDCLGKGTRSFIREDGEPDYEECPWCDGSDVEADADPDLDFSPNW